MTATRNAEHACSPMFDQVIAERLAAEQAVQSPERGVDDRVVLRRRAKLEPDAPEPVEGLHRGDVRWMSSSQRMPPRHAGWYAASVASTSSGSSAHARWFEGARAAVAARTDLCGLPDFLVPTYRDWTPGTLKCCYGLVI